MKKRFIYICFFVVLITLGLQQALAVNCKPTFNRSYTVEGNCTWPGNYKVFGNITVGNYTVTIPTGLVMGIDLGANKITFNTGKILIQGTSKIDNSVSTKYYESVPYQAGTTSIIVTPCPAGGFEPLNRINANVPTGYVGSTVRSVNQNGTMHCGK